VATTVGGTVRAWGRLAVEESMRPGTSEQNSSSSAILRSATGKREARSALKPDAFPDTIVCPVIVRTVKLRLFEHAVVAARGGPVET
jgi:hypothetical protein